MDRLPTPSDPTADDPGGSVTPSTAYGSYRGGSKGMDERLRRTIASGLACPGRGGTVCGSVDTSSRDKSGRVGGRHADGWPYHNRQLDLQPKTCSSGGSWRHTGNWKEGRSGGAVAYRSLLAAAGRPFARRCGSHRPSTTVFSYWLARPGDIDVGESRDLPPAENPSYLKLQVTGYGPLAVGDCRTTPCYRGGVSCLSRELCTGGQDQLL